MESKEQQPGQHNQGPREDLGVLKNEACDLHLIDDTHGGQVRAADTWRSSGYPTADW
jgi:hypothetical protein